MGEATRSVLFAWRLLQQVRRTRLAAENRIRAANACQYCSGKRSPKVDHECPECTPTRCAHCGGTGLAPILLPEAMLADYGVDIARLKEVEHRLELRLLRMARRHPDWPRLRAVAERWPGVGEGLLAALLGIAGDLRAYATPRRLMHYMGMGVGTDGRAMRLRRGRQAGFRPEGQAWCFLVMQQWRRYRRYPPEWEDVVALEQSKDERRAVSRAARKLVQRLLRDLWVAVNAEDMAPASVNANNRGRDHANEPSRVAGAGAADGGGS